MEVNVRVVLSSHGKGEVYINGAKVEGVVSVKCSAEVNAANRVEIALLPSKVEFSGIAEVTTIESEAREFQAYDNGA